MGTLVYSWPDAYAKAQVADKILRARLDRLGLNSIRCSLSLSEPTRPTAVWPASRTAICRKCSCESVSAAKIVPQ